MKGKDGNYFAHTLNNTIKLFFVALAFLNVNPAYSFERIDLDPNRTPVFPVSSLPVYRNLENTCVTARL